MQSDRAFTLIELLVVVTIIVVLLALLTPALDKAMSAAEIAVCGSNQKQVVNAAVTWATSNNRKLPGGSYKPGRANNDPNYAGSWMGNRDTWAGVIPGYTPTGSSPLLYCPSMLQVWSPKIWQDNNASGDQAWGYSYFAQYPFPGGAWASPLPSPTKITERTTIPIIGDVTRGAFKNHPRFQRTPVWVHIPHGVTGNGLVAPWNGGNGRDEDGEFKPRGTNNGHVDGSVVFFKYDTETGGEFEYAVQLGAYPGFMWGKTPGSSDWP